MVDEMVNVLELPVAIEGNPTEVPAIRQWYKRSEYRNLGGYALEWAATETGGGFVELRLNGPDTEAVRHWFATAEEAKAEYDRLEALLWVRTWAGWVADKFPRAGILPAEFLGGVLAGELETLLVAADWQDEHDKANAAMLLRAAYYRIRGQANVAVRAGKGRVIILNPDRVTPKHPAKPGIGDCRAAVIEEGKSIRIERLVEEVVYVKDVPVPHTQPMHRIEEKTFMVGQAAEFDSYNLVYYGSIESISAKTVVVDGSHRGSKRLTIGAFVEKNHDFDLAKAQKRNNDWSD
jgi:hypothetical protein